MMKLQYHEVKNNSLARYKYMQYVAIINIGTQTQTVINIYFVPDNTLIDICNMLFNNMQCQCFNRMRVDPWQVDILECAQSNKHILNYMQQTTLSKQH
jgi:hypothetical protein